MHRRLKARLVHSCRGGLDFGIQTIVGAHKISVMGEHFSDLHHCLQGTCHVG